jgi:MFS family permease
MGILKTLQSVSPIFACGTALFSDGYANGIISDLNFLLNRIYDNELTAHKYTNIISSMVFAGTIVGMLLFGWLSDRVGRQWGMMTATGIVAFFSLLCAASQGAHDNLTGLIAMLSVFRFLLGIGVGAEYPCGSVAASERSEEKDIAKMSQHRWFALATNCMIDFGFVISTFVPLVLFWIFGENHLRAVWRMSLGLGFFPAIAVLVWRIGMKEPERFQKDTMKNTKIPYSLVIRRYWKSLAAVSFIWFLYDFIVYPFGIYSGIVVNNITGGSDAISVVLGWNIVINLFYMPGTIGGAFIVDYLGPKYTLIVGLLLQSIIGYIMSGLYKQLTNHIAAFAVLYGIFLSFGELGPGNCTGLLASKSCATAVRGQFYGIAAATGKVGAFVGTWAFPQIIIDFGGSSSTRGNTGPFWIASSLAILSALVTFFFVKPIHTDGMAAEDVKFREYLEQNGYDTSQMGLISETSSVEPAEDVKEDVKEETPV